MQTGQYQVDQGVGVGKTPERGLPANRASLFSGKQLVSDSGRGWLAPSHVLMPVVTPATQWFKPRNVQLHETPQVVN